MTESVENTRSEKINCLLVAGVDPLTQNLRTGAALRYHNAPQNVSYYLRVEKLGYPKYLGHYGLAPFSVPLSTAKLLAESLFPLKEKRCSIIHSLFWSLHRYSLPWIHENDQALGQYLSEYVHFNGTLMRRITDFSAALLNSKKCKGVIVWSEWAKKGYIRDGIERGKIRVIPPPFTMCSSRIKHDTINLLFLGRDYDRKGGDVALEVFRELKRLHENIHLIFIGNIPDKDVLQTVKDDKKISFYDHVPTSFLHQNIFPTTDIFLLPTKAEAYGMSLVEAMSYGIPVVSSGISAIPEIVEDSICGYLCQPSQVEDYIKKCSLLIEDKEKMTFMGNNAKEVVANKFSSKKIGNKLYDFYSEILSDDTK